MLLSKGGMVPIKSEIGREDVMELGKLTYDILSYAGYNKDENNTKSTPGWVFQCANDWLTRILDLYDITPTINENPELPSTYPRNRAVLIDMLMNPIVKIGPEVGEDIRFCIIEDQTVRKTLYDLTALILENL